MHRTHIGLQIPYFTYQDVPPAQLFERIAAQAVSAERSGFDTVFVMDHFYQLPMMGPPELEMFESYTLLAALAARTERIRLGTLVTGVTYRHPGLLAKIVATLDVLSGGRAQLGIGAGWYEREHRALGVPFPPVAERFERLEETLQICMQMWSDDDGPFEGRHYQLAETMCSPRPISAPRPPILIGGGGERKTLRLVARYADACNLFAFDPDEIAHKLEVLTQHCRTEGRDPDTVEVTIVFARDSFDVARYASLGVTTIDVVPTGDPVAFVERAGTELIPRLADLDVAA